MVRAGVVTHPAQWRWGGYHEIQAQRQRYRIIDRERLAELLGVSSTATLAETHTHWVEAALRQAPLLRQPLWTESVAVGSRQFVQEIAGQLANDARGRQVVAHDDIFCLRDEPAPYAARSSVDVAFLIQSPQYSWTPY